MVSKIDLFSFLVKSDSQYFFDCDLSRLNQLPIIINISPNKRTILQLNQSHPLDLSYFILSIERDRDWLLARLRKAKKKFASLESEFEIERSKNHTEESVGGHSNMSSVDMDFSQESSLLLGLYKSKVSVQCHTLILFTLSLYSSSTLQSSHTRLQRNKKEEIFHFLTIPPNNKQHFSS